MLAALLLLGALGAGAQEAPIARPDLQQNVEPSEVPPRRAELVIGKDAFASPETVVWDDRRDVYLVSNVHGGLTALDDNGFISRVTPEGRIMELKWIDGGERGVTLHGPKGMLLTEEHLVVADVHTLRLFDRDTGEQVRTYPVPGSYMLNDPARAEDGTLYCTDTGSATTAHPGGVYRFEGDGHTRIAHGTEYDRPDGLITDGDALLVTPFGSHADEVYRLSPSGERTLAFRVPGPKLDGLLRLPDGRLIVTSWKGKAVYAVSPDGSNTETLLEGLTSPAQIGYDRSRDRLLVPQLKENLVRVYVLGGGS